MNKLVPALAIATLVAFFAAGCATPPAEETRVHLGGQSFVELRLPVGWEFRPIFDQQPMAKNVRVFRAETEVMNVIPVQWTNAATEPDANQSQLRDRARMGLQQRGYCTNAAIHERALPQGLALYCAGSVEGGRITGVLANGRMTAAFAFLEPQAEAALWQVLGTVKHFSFAYAASEETPPKLLI